MMENRVKLTTWIKDILIFLILLTFIIPIPVRFSVPAVEIKLDDKDFLEHRTINVHGWYRINIFTDCQFSGRITISGYPETFNRMSDIQFMKDAGNGSALIYWPEDGPECIFGRFQAEFPFRRMVVLLFERSAGNSGFSTIDGRCLVARARSYTEALKVLKAQHIVSHE